MDPTGNSIERVPAGDTLQLTDHNCDVYPQVGVDKKTVNRNVPLIKKILNADGSSTLRRTSSFMLRSKTESGGTRIIIRKCINRSI